MHASDVTPEVARQANDLYWTGDRSVNQITEDLDLSKGALYGLLEPVPSAQGCPLCGAEVMYQNRTARERGRVNCLVCEWDGSVDGTEAYAPDGEQVSGNDARGRVPSRMTGGSLPAARLNTIAGGALLGAALGLALVLWARRR